MIRFRDVTPSVENASGFFNFRQIEKAIKNDQWPIQQVTLPPITGLPTATQLSIENYVSTFTDISIKNSLFVIEIQQIHYTLSTVNYPVILGTDLSNYNFGQNTVLKVIVNSGIYGAGGSGGLAGTTEGGSGTDGQNGGPALFANYTLSNNQSIIIINNAEILGGGGGGGGGGAGGSSNVVQYTSEDGTYQFQFTSFANIGGGFSGPARSIVYWENATALTGVMNWVSYIDATSIDGWWYIRGNNVQGGYYEISRRKFGTAAVIYGNGGAGGAGASYNVEPTAGSSGQPSSGFSGTMGEGGNGGTGGNLGQNGDNGVPGFNTTSFWNGGIPYASPRYNTNALTNDGAGGTAGVAITGINKITLINNGTVGTTI